MESKINKSFISKNYLCFVYLFLAVIGAVLPTLSNIEFIKQYGPEFDISKFIELANVNSAAQSLSRDLFIGASAITIWIVSEARRLKMRNLWLVFLSMFLIAFACAAPLFLYLRECRLIEIKEEGAV